MSLLSWMSSLLLLLKLNFNFKTKKKNEKRKSKTSISIMNHRRSRRNSGVRFDWLCSTASLHRCDELLLLIELSFEFGNLFRLWLITFAHRLQLSTQRLQKKKKFIINFVLKKVKSQRVRRVLRAMFRYRHRSNHRHSCYWKQVYTISFSSLKKKTKMKEWKTLTRFVSCH